MNVLTTVRRRAPRVRRPKTAPAARRADYGTAIFQAAQPEPLPGLGRRIAHPSERRAAVRATGAPTHRAGGPAR